MNIVTRSLDAASASSTAGSEHNYDHVCFNHHAQIYFTNTGGSVTALVIAFQGTMDGLHWDTMDSKTFSSSELTAKQASWTLGNNTYGALRTRLYLTTLTQTGTSAVTGFIGGQ